MTVCTQGYNTYGQQGNGDTSGVTVGLVNFSTPLLTGVQQVATQTNYYSAPNYYSQTCVLFTSGVVRFVLLVYRVWCVVLSLCPRWYVHESFVCTIVVFYER